MPGNGFGMPAGLWALLAIALLALPGIGARYHLNGDFHVLHVVFSLFFSVNLLICYWEACLFFRRDYIEARRVYWRDRARGTGRRPVREFLSTSVPPGRVLSPTIWADVWATYSQFDESYSDRRTYGFNVDIANGFVTPAPTLILYGAYTVPFLPAVLAGILGVMLFWQWTYATSVYLVSFFVARRHIHLARGEVYGYILAMNSPWVLCALVGLYVSVRLILDGHYGVLGY
ncbi:MAG: hypothetical protein F4Z04_12590 [Acidobacteria bacterium]|nr:hypothetical protein [Acidobacteriota bacterium]